MFSHMLKNTDNDKRCIYAYEFIDNNVYVGLTKNIITRNRQHMKKGSVYEYKKICNNYKFLQSILHQQLKNIKTISWAF